MPADPKAILDAAQSFADDFMFNDNRSRSEKQYHAENANGKFTVNIIPDGPGFAVDASDSKVLDAVKKFICDRIGAPAPTQNLITKEQRQKIEEIKRQKRPMPAQSQGGITAQDVINYINPKATEAEAYLFAEFCRRKGADPMTKQVYLVIYEGQNGRQCNFIAGKEYFTEKAEAHPQLAGFQAGVIVRKKEGGTLERRVGTFWLKEEEELLGGWAEVERKDRAGMFRMEVPLSDYDTKKNLWVKMPATMIRKVALVQALREAFPSNFGGMYDRSEMDQAGVIEGEYEVQEARA